MTYLIFIIISICFAGLLYLIANKRGLNKIFWAIMGFVFGPFALPFIFFAKASAQTGKNKIYSP